MRQFESRDFVIIPFVPMLHIYTPKIHSVAVPSDSQLIFLLGQLEFPSSEKFLSRLDFQAQFCELY